MALKLLDVKNNDLVFCSSLTFVASCNPIIYERAVPVFIDSEPESFNMSPKALKRAFEYYEEKNMKPKVVIVVHLYGQSADMDEIIEICNFYNVPIVEDAAESLGATYKGKQTGTMGEFGVFSFNGNKIITTSAGGMLVSNDMNSIEKARFWATQARDKARYYQHSELGYNYRMSNILAGIGRGQLKMLNKRIAKKKSIFEFYDRNFRNIPWIDMEEICDYGTSNYWLSVMTLSKGCKIKPIDIKPLEELLKKFLVLHDEFLNSINYEVTVIPNENFLSTVADGIKVMFMKSEEKAENTRIKIKNQVIENKDNIASILSNNIMENLRGLSDKLKEEIKDIFEGTLNDITIDKNIVEQAEMDMKKSHEEITKNNEELEVLMKFVDVEVLKYIKQLDHNMIYNKSKCYKLV